MNKLRPINAQNNQQNFMTNHMTKSPFKRNNINNHHHNNTQRSPIRSRTPQKNKTITNNNALFPTQIKYISNVSPIKQKNNSPLKSSNGQYLKYYKTGQHQNHQQSNRKESKLEFSKKGDKNVQDQNRLFGKIVDKLNSQKKNGLKSNQNSQKTSIFGQNSQRKPSKIDQLPIKTQGTFKNILNNVKNIQSKHSIIRKHQKSVSKANQPILPDDENLSCIVYTINNTQIMQQQQYINLKEQKKQQQIGKHIIENKIIRRKSSKLLNDTNEQKNVSLKDDNENKLLNMLLQKIETSYKHQIISNKDNDQVKMSINLMNSLSMQPFI